MKKGVFNQASLKICKTDQKQVNSLVKLSRAKVYISDSSSFKRLVQELTGNGGGGSKHRSLTPPQKKLFGEVPVLKINDPGEGESSGKFCVFDSPKLNVPVLSPCSSFTGLQNSWMYKNTTNDVFPDQELASYDPFSFLDGYTFQSEQELRNSDYNLSEFFDTLWSI